MAKSAQLLRLEKRLQAIPQAVREAVKPALQKSADELVALQKQLAPVDKGALRESIREEPGDNELQVKVVAGDAKAFYARWEEFGTARTPAHPFFFPAYRLLRKRLQARIKRSITKAVKTEWTK